jgi:hypothetical protein
MKVARTLLTALAVASGSLGCFSLHHQLPPNAYFGTLPDGANEDGVAFESDGFKSWTLAGLMPYSRWDSSDLLAVQVASDAQAIRIREIETVFSPLDVVISVVPGTAVGLYYVWATRTIRVSGEVQGSAQ